MISKSRLQRTTKERPHSSMKLLHGRRFSHITSRRRRSTAAQVRGARGTLRPRSPCCAHTSPTRRTRLSVLDRLSVKRYKCAESTAESSARCVRCDRSSTDFMKRAALAHAVRVPARFVSSLRRHTCTRAAREAISDNHTVCWSAHSADCRALPSRSISSDACTTRPSPGACGPP